MPMNTPLIDGPAEAAPDASFLSETARARTATETPVILSFDVEEHYRIESAAGVPLSETLKAQSAARLEPATHWVLERLAAHDLKATFFILGEIARDYPALVRAIAGAGHEVASHGWDHQRLHHLTPATFRADVRQSKDVLEQTAGQPVLGYRAPTFSLVPQTAWAVDVLIECDLRYDSSIYPVRHDRYGIPQAPRGPFWLRGPGSTILELPPVTWRLLGTNVPAGGGGYFRLLPLWLLERALRQARALPSAVAMLYFHPWEFDPDQPRLPLRGMNRFRTYVGLGRSQQRLDMLLKKHTFVRTVDVLGRLEEAGPALPTFALPSLTHEDLSPR